MNRRPHVRSGRRTFDIVARTAETLREFLKQAPHDGWAHTDVQRLTADLAVIVALSNDLVRCADCGLYGAEGDLRDDRTGDPASRGLAIMWLRSANDHLAPAAECLEAASERLSHFYDANESVRRRRGADEITTASRVRSLLSRVRGEASLGRGSRANSEEPTDG